MIPITRFSKPAFRHLASTLHPSKVLGRNFAKTTLKKPLPLRVPQHDKDLLSITRGMRHLSVSDETAHEQETPLFRKIFNGAIHTVIGATLVYLSFQDELKFHSLVEELRGDDMKVIEMLQKVNFNFSKLSHVEMLALKEVGPFPTVKKLSIQSGSLDIDDILSQITKTFPNLEDLSVGSYTSPIKTESLLLLKELRTLHLQQNHTEIQSLETLRALPHLSSLYFQSSPDQLEKNFEALDTFPALTHLEVQILDDKSQKGHQNLKPLKRVMSLSLKYAGHELPLNMKVLATFPSLQELSLSHIQIVDFPVLENLQKLTISDTSFGSKDEEFFASLRSFFSLRSLSLDMLFDHKLLKTLEKLTQLDHFEVVFSGYSLPSVEEISILQKSLPKATVKVLTSICRK